MYEFKLPDLGEGIHECEVLSWHVEVGAVIEEDAPLADVETDKAALTIPSPRAGRIVSLTGEIGDTLLVGDVLVVIDDGSSLPAPAEPAAASAPLAASAPVAVSAPVAAAAAGRSTSGRVIAAPAVRRLAREGDIDIAEVSGTGPGGRVTREDLQRFAEGGRPAAGDADEGRATFEASVAAADAIPFLELKPMPDFAAFGPIETEALRSIRRKVARKMVTSMVLVPHVVNMDEADVTELEAFRKRERQRRAGGPGERLTLLSFLMKAVIVGLKETPVFNASIDPYKEEIVYKKYYNVGFAADTPGGLVVPVLRDADQKNILQLSTELEELAGRAREGKLAAADMRGGTFTITNVGPLGGTGMIPTINYPEVAILAMGRAQQKPVVVEGEIVIRTMLPLTLAFDHRIADGVTAARFLTALVGRISDPNRLLMDV